MIYAIIQDGGKQYKVSPGSVVELEKKDCAAGSSIEFKDIIYYHDQNEIKIGTPKIEKMTVKGVVEGLFKGPKIRMFKFRRRKDSRWRKGHRQQYSKVRIVEIVKE